MPLHLFTLLNIHARIQGEGVRKHKAVGLLSNTGPDPLKNYKAAKPAHNAGPSSAHKLRFACGPKMPRFYWYFDPLSPSSTNNKRRPPLTKLSGSAHDISG